ncbi:MAG: tRNA (adenosine(37)-N6)-threonylcarbamoyltransferase complex dimerization subunit type 1 TsaB [Solirubrobacterales bacterium]
MKVVGFDCATDDAVLAACDGQEVMFERSFPPGANGRPTHTRSLLGGISSAADALGGWGSVDRISVGLGPGTFTGLRIAASTASGLALSTGVAVTGVSTLEVMALSLGARDGLRFPVLDARRGEVFVAAYDAQGEEVLPPAALPPEAAIESILGISGPVTVGGPGAVRFDRLFADAGISIESPESANGRLSGVAICRLGAEAPTPEPGQTPQPIYIREPDAKLWLERDTRESAR